MMGGVEGSKVSSIQTNTAKGGISDHHHHHAVSRQVGKTGGLYCPEDSMVDAEWDDGFWDDGLGEGRGNYEDVGLRDVRNLGNLLAKKENANKIDLEAL